MAKKEKFSERVKRAYEQGYIQGFQDSEKAGAKGNRFWGARGYSVGYRDRRRVDKINKRFARYKKDY